MRKKNYKDHKCFICDREFKSVRFYVSYCSNKCRNYSNTKKYVKNMILGLKIDPHNPPEKTVYRRISTFAPIVKNMNK
jgi:hypothetical protein